LGRAMFLRDRSRAATSKNKKKKTICTPTSWDWKGRRSASAEEWGKRLNLWVDGSQDCPNARELKGAVLSAGKANKKVSIWEERADIPKESESRSEVVDGRPVV